MRAAAPIMMPWCISTSLSKARTSPSLTRSMSRTLSSSQDASSVPLDTLGSRLEGHSGSGMTGEGRRPATLAAVMSGFNPSDAGWLRGNSAGFPPCDPVSRALIDRL
jgi:hypothetical protein